MKKIVALLMVSVMTLSLCSCWGSDPVSELPPDSGVEDVSKEVKEEIEKEEVEKEPVLEEEEK